MTYAELVAEVRRLSLEERLQLLEILTRSVREDLAAPPSREPSAALLRGLLKPDGPPPTDAELTEGYIDYLTEKYT